MKRKIVQRQLNAQGRIVRVLTCGHQQEEPHGSKAQYAQRAFCKLCGLERQLQALNLPDVNGEGID